MGYDRPVMIASAAGVSGYFTRPEAMVVPTQAAAVIGSAGGFCESKAQSLLLTGLLRTTGAAATASGTVSPAGSLILSADASVVAAEIRGIVRVDSVRAALRAEINQGKRSVSATLSIEGLHIANSELRVTFSVAPQHLTFDGLPSLPTRAGSVAISWLDGGAPGVLIDGSSVTIPDFGTIWFGDTLLTSAGWQLTAMRVQLGSPVGGVVSFGSVMAGALYLPGDPTTPVY